MVFVEVGWSRGAGCVEFIRVAMSLDTVLVISADRRRTSSSLICAVRVQSEVDSIRGCQEDRRSKEKT